MASIGRYRIVKKLATGGMAEVYLAKVAGPGGFEKHVVVKQILPQLQDSELYVKMFLEEARLAAQLDHPNIVHVFDFGEVEGSYFLAMEYVEGANLRHVLRWAFRTGHTFHPHVAARIITLACEGLAYAHQFNAPGTGTLTKLVHRDVSPENIMLSHTGAVKLLDFGVAKNSAEDNRSKVGSLKGKIAFMPPEQLKGENIDRRVDIYALGVVLYMALSGKRPYGQATDVALIQAILNEEPVPLLKHRLDLPDNLLDIVSKAMSKKPQARFQTCEELRDALDAYIAHEGQPANAAQIAQLVAAYTASTAEAASANAGGTAGASSGLSSAGSRGPEDSGSHPRLATPAGTGGADALALDGVAPKAAGNKPLWPTGWNFGRGAEITKPERIAQAPGSPLPQEPGTSPAAQIPHETVPGVPPEAPLLSAAPAAETPGIAVPPPLDALPPTPPRGIPMKTTPGTPAFNAALAAVKAAMPQLTAAPVASRATQENAETVKAPVPVAPGPQVTASPAQAPRASSGGTPLPQVTAMPVTAPVSSLPQLTPATVIVPKPAPPAGQVLASPTLTPQPSAPRGATPSRGTKSWQPEGPPSPQPPAPGGTTPSRATKSWQPEGPRPAGAPIAASTVPAPQPSAPLPASELHATRAWAPVSVTPEPVRLALREALRADRSSTLLRKLPAVISRLCDLSPSIPWSMAEAFAGALDAAVLSDDHSAIVRVLDRATQRPGQDARFASLTAAELSSPVRMAWLIERLRSGLPGDMAGLRSWLLRVAPQAGELLINALEMSEPGPAQELFAEAVAITIPTDPAPIIERLKEPKVRDAAALAFALERSGAPERAKVFQKLIGRREVPLQVELLTGRARARGAEALVLLEGAMGDKAEDIRRRATKLVGELCGAKGFALLLQSLKDASFESRSLAERAQLWTAALECGGAEAAAEVEQVLLSKGSLLNKKKVNDAKLALIEGLSRAKTEPARATLEKVAIDRAQGDEVQQAAAQALDGARRASGEVATEHKAIGEWRVHLLARISLDFVLLARATTTVDVASGLLDSAIDRFRDGVRQLVSQDGKLQLVFTADGPMINNTVVTYGPLHEAVAPAVTAAMRLRDLQGFAVEAMLPAAEFKSLLLRAFDPEGARERLPHIKAITFANQPLAAVTDPPPPVDATARLRELFAQVVRWLSAQRDALRSERPFELPVADAALDECVRLVDQGQARFLGLQRWPASETGPLVHAANTALVAMAFAHDIGLTRTALRELAELSVMLGLAEAVGKPELRPQPGEPTLEDQRFYAAGLVLTNRVNRLGTAAAIGVVEAGMPYTARGGPGLLASIHALAKTFDALTAGTGGTNAQALEAINGRLRARFSPDLIGLFTQWAFAQGSAG